jgi:hypothetical protein
MRDRNLPARTRMFMPYVVATLFIPALGGAYERGIGSGLDWFMGPDVTWESKQWASASNLTHTGDPLIWNAWTGLRADDWTLSFYLDNIP